MTHSLPDRIDLREVGPRDGLQVERPIEPAGRALLINALGAAGCRHIEAVSFVSERSVPSMARPAEVLASLDVPPGTTVAALVPNETGARRALAARLGARPGGIDELTVTVAASATYNERNVHRSIDQSLVEIERIARIAGAGTPATRVDAVISCAFGSPYEGDIDPAEVAALGRRVLGAGADRLTLADTTGMATPRVLAATFTAFDAVGIPASSLGLHAHETRGTALLNAYTALLAGVRRFDTSLGGLGGSPFAAGAGGNLSTEDFVALLDDLGVQTGIDLESLLRTASLLRQLVGHDLPSKVSAAGPRSRLAAEG